MGSSSPDAVSPVGESRLASRFTFRVDTPPVKTQSSQGQVRFEIEGFVVHERRPGAPDLPSRTVLVAIPPDVTPRLELRGVRERARPGLRPLPVPREVVTTRFGDDRVDPGRLESLRADPRRVDRGLEHRPDPAFYAAVWPQAIARLGEIGVLRDQRYVEVHLAPVRWDPGIGGVRIAERFEVSVAFDGDDGRRTAPAADPLFESVYRRSFVNYDQGRSFRLGALAPAAPAVEASTDGPGTDDPSARRRIRVRDDGIVRLDYNRMSATGFITEPLSTWKLTNRGEEVPLHVRDDDGDAVPEPTDGNDLLDPGEWVQFYGQALDDEPKTALNTDLTGPDDIWELRDFGDENVYFLTVETGPRSRVTERDAAPPHTLTPPAHFEGAARAEVDDAWRPLASADPWWWSPTLIGPDSIPTDVPLPGLFSGTESARVIVELQGRSEDANVFPDHATRITLQNSSSQTLKVDNDDGTFDGRMVYTHDFNWDFVSGPQLSDPAKVLVEALSPPNGAARNDAIRNFIEIRYRRSFQAIGDVIEFSWPDGDQEFEITNVQSAVPEVYEISGRVGGSDVADPVRLTGVEVTGLGPYTVRFRMDDNSGTADRTFVVTGDAAATVPADPDFEIDTVSTLRDTAIQADFLVIAHPDVLDDPVNCQSTKLTQLLNHRLSQDGLTSKVACLQDVYDEFNDGLPGPSAIENFLTWVFCGVTGQPCSSADPGAGWQAPKPSYVMFLGDGSYDYKAGTANGSFVPTQILLVNSPITGYYASDNLLAAVLGADSMPDLMPGRIPARTIADADLVLQKILDYEQAPPLGNWRKHAVTVADRGKRAASGAVNVGESLEFENTNASALSFLKVPPHTSRELRYWSDFCDTMAAPPEPCDKETMRQAIKDAVNAADAFDGTSIIQFTGHGNVEVWSDDAFFDERDPATLRDTNDLFNGGRLPWMMAHNCLTGGFHTLLDHSMGENWLLRDDGSGGGGAVAVYSPTGLSFGFLGRTVSDILWEDLFGPPKERNVAVPVLDSLMQLCSQGSTEACQNYAYLGDPALKLVFPAVDPASALRACAGHEQVDLSWTGNGTTGTTYDVYRSTWPDRDYSLITSTTATTHLDSGLTNTVTYYYYVVARDTDGFESRWSNFNADCDGGGDECVGDGDECVEAVPLNPNPPSPPTGLVVTDAETGGRLDLTWNASPESDVNLYEVHYSTESGCFVNPSCTPSTDGIGRRTFHSLHGLQDGTEYFVVVTATNSSGKRSGPSTERSGTPTLVRGVKSPAWIADLMVDKAGSDAVLSWSAVTDDIYGKSESVARYEVYRGTTPQFVPSISSKVGETTSTSFTDSGALAPGGPDYFWLVRAVDVDGNGGGLGRQLPDGIRDLTLEWGVTGSCSITSTQACQSDPDCPSGETCDTQPDRTRLILSWPAVTRVFQPDGNGGPTTIERYELYGGDAPFSRSEICDPLDGACTGLTPLQSVTGTSLEIQNPPPQSRYYSVIAVDSRGNPSPF